MLTRMFVRLPGFGSLNDGTAMQFTATRRRADTILWSVPGGVDARPQEAATLGPLTTNGNVHEVRYSMDSPGG